MRLERMTWPQVETYFKENDMVIVGIGSVECHGVHLALGTDTLAPNRIIELIEEKSDVLIAPTLPYGACDYLADFPGTISLGTDVLYQTLSKITQGLLRHGAKKFVFVNGHGGNVGALDQICLELSKQGAYGAQMNWWLMAWDLNPKWKGGHGGAEETSAMLAIDEALVDKTAIRDMGLRNDISDKLETSGFKTIRFKGIDIPMARSIYDFSDNGWIGDDHPKYATKAWGEDMLQAVADYIVEFMEAFKEV